VWLDLVIEPLFHRMSRRRSVRNQTFIERILLTPHSRETKCAHFVSRENAGGGSVSINISLLRSEIQESDTVKFRRPDSLPWRVRGSLYQSVL
jgi:hypothetical protein